mmetsp:Transcript_83215/g.168831  ORF Transcript_83215/g.168831 Transcript_83215/m.168831 type:complete len:234 (+) Transcript_83215:2-703(+)
MAVSEVSESSFADGLDAEAVEEEKPLPPGPSLDLQFDIAPPFFVGGFGGFGSIEASPLLDEPAECNPAHIEEVRRQLANPYSALRLRLKDRLEKAISRECELKFDLAKPPLLDVRKPKPEPTMESIMGLRERPKATGGAYMMRGPTVAEAPFVGHKYEHTGKVEVSLKKVPLPAHYQPYRPENDQPHGREPPSAEKPMGERRLPPEDWGRAFELVRPTMAIATAAPNRVQRKH